MHRRTWQREETEVARAFSGDPEQQRRGESGHEIEDGGVEGFSIEVKLHKAMGFAKILNEAKSAERKAGPTDIPVAVVRTPGVSKNDRLVCMRIETFLEWFGPGGASCATQTEE